MSSSSRRPLTTYSRRRARRRDTEPAATKSSPIRALSPDKEEVAFSVMANRMNKRARLVSRSINAADNAEKAGDKDGLTEGRPHKRQKPTSSPDTNARPDGDYMRDTHLPTASHIQSPHLAAPSDHIMVFSPAGLAPAAKDRLSPLPVAKRILSRTSSRNFKENAAQLGSRSLASPFSSRPGSRASSPSRNALGMRKRSAHHSRALSQLDALQEKVVDRNIIQATYPAVPQVPQTITGGTNSSTYDKPNIQAQAHHNRSSSTPALTPALDLLSSRNPAKPALPLPPPTTHSDAGDDIEHGRTDTAIEHASFFIDTPMQVSTPPRRRRSSTVGAWVHGLMPQLDADPPPPVRSFCYDSDVDMTDSSLPGSPLESYPSRPDPPRRRRRRRTIVHLSSDSLFSSSLDFSALLSETKQYPRPPASEGSRSPELRSRVLESNLGPAFSLSSSPISSASRIGSNRMATTRSVRSVSSQDSSDGRRDLPGPPPSSSSGLPVQVDPDPEGDELLDLFSVLGLDEDQKWTSFHRADDSGVVLSSSPRSVEARTSSTSAVAKHGGVGRKRGDTIRASDYTKFPPMGTSTSFDTIPPPKQLSASRRTRSGTVTQASSSGGTRRKHDGWPTIKMRTNPEPLCADENGDDELLLKDGDVIE